jgi:hypothetical protein
MAGANLQVNDEAAIQTGALAKAIDLYNLLVTAFDAHTHGGTTAGGANSGAPTTAVTAGKVADERGNLRT